jgi:hypothetical protein
LWQLVFQAVVCLSSVVHSIDTQQPETQVSTTLQNL